MDHNLLIAGGISLFGSAVHVGNEYRKNPEQIAPVDASVLYLTANFSGMVFGLLALLIGDDKIHLYLAVSTGSFLGISGLSRITDIIIAVIAKR